MTRSKESDAEKGPGQSPNQPDGGRSAQGPAQDQPRPGASRTPDGDGGTPQDPTTEVQALAAERDDLLARLQHVSADYVNYQKRARRDMAEAREFANAELIKALLPVLDDMERALAAGREGPNKDDPMLAGMRLVYDKAVEVLRGHGLRPIQAEGQPFDPTRHEAIMQQPSAEHGIPTVLAEVQRGYEFKGRVLRPARVVVSAPQEGPTAADAGEAEAPDKGE